MDDANIRFTHRTSGKTSSDKVRKLMSFAGDSRSVADPWYTGDFDTTFRDVKEGCDGLMRYLGIL